MLGHVGRRTIFYLIGSTIFASFIGYVLYKAGLLSFRANNPKTLNSKERNRNRRVGRIRVT